MCVSVAYEFRVMLGSFPALAGSDGGMIHKSFLSWLIAYHHRPRASAKSSKTGKPMFQDMPD